MVLEKLIMDIEEILKEEEKLIEIKNASVIIIGDIHGDYLSLERILKDLKDEKIVFLGDYADRGPSPIEVYEKIFELKVSRPKEVFLLRGNHEAPDLLPFHPHDFPWHLNLKYRDRWREIYKKFIGIYNKMPIALIIEKLALLLHGGISPEIKIENLKNPDEKILEIILWSDPSDEIHGVLPSYRGAGIIFGPDVSFKVLSEINVKYLIRSHQPTIYGYKWNHNMKVLTIFSSKNVYNLINGAYVKIVNGNLEIVKF
ncbi:MAG: metallophosphoesterase family protein [Candidatus Methanomethylicaceae archaeon]